MSQEITTRAIGDTAELARPNPNPARGLTRLGGQAMDDFGSADPAGPVEMQEVSFFDFLDIINPLQHIPIVSSLYRAATGESSTAQKPSGNSAYAARSNAAKASGLVADGSTNRFSA